MVQIFPGGYWPGKDNMDSDANIPITRNNKLV